MKVLVAVKRVVDHKVKIRINAAGSAVETQHAKMSMNPFDEIAVEEAIRLKEQGLADEVIVVSIGEKSAQDTLRSALAMGADRATLVETEDAVEPIHVAKLLKALIAELEPGLVLLGKQAIDDDCGQTGQMLAGLLGWPQATFASELLLAGDKAEVTREVDGGLERLAIQLPAVVTTDLRLNEPRYTSLPNIMKAKSKPLVTTTPQALGVSIQSQLKVLKVTSPPARAKGVKVNNINELFDQLKEKMEL